MRTRRNSKARYRVLDGKASVELKLRTPHQLFDERDPAPFRERDLDDDAARYILASFRELRDHNDVKLSLYFDSLGKFSDRPEVIEDAIHAFFSFESEMKRRELRDIFRQGIISLIIGVTFLCLCTNIAVKLGVLGLAEGAHENWVGTMLHEGLFIMGWVAMWRPISIFLYEWWPIQEALTTFKRLGALEVEVLPMQFNPQPPEYGRNASRGPIPNPNFNNKSANLRSVREWKDWKQEPSTV